MERLGLEQEAQVGRTSGRRDPIDQSDDSGVPRASGRIASRLERRREWPIRLCKTIAQVGPQLLLIPLATGQLAISAPLLAPLLPSSLQKGNPSTRSPQASSTIRPHDCRSLGDYPPHTGLALPTDSGCIVPPRPSDSSVGIAGHPSKLRVPPATAPSTSAESRASPGVDSPRQAWHPCDSSDSLAWIHWPVPSAKSRRSGRSS
jgi:hypothetical protein